VLVSDFHFDLPAELIAQHPPAVRGASRMLALDRASGRLADERFENLPQLLQPGDLLILNDSRVLPARLFATRAGMGTQANSPRPAGPIEVLLTEEIGSRSDSDPTSQTRDAHPSEQARRGRRDVGHPPLWRALVRPAKKVRVGETLLFFEAGQDGQPALVAEVVEAGEFGERTLRFGAVEDFYGTLDRIGHMPLPPYILRDRRAQQDTAEDRERYQTVYSRQPGSAAAPTAGLHLTPQVLAALAARGVEIESLTLHVGLGTFQPVRVERLEDIRLHAERYTLPEATASALNRALTEGRRIIAVGTTTTRTLEHIAASGEGAIRPHSGSTAIFIAPGHRFRVVSGLLTNFHLSESTLLMLVSAFAAPPASPAAGRQAILDAYAHAVRERYRFYSYGDCMLVL
jgi:S-adenosylmethionine:tRNA ribosyltransferase-isomerase